MIKTIESGTSKFDSSNKKTVAFTKAFSSVPVIAVASLRDNTNLFVSTTTIVNFIVEKGSEDATDFFWTAIEI